MAEYCLLELASPGGAGEPAGVLLLDPARNRLHARLRRSWPEEDADILELLEEDLAHKAREMGGAGLLGWLEDSLSHRLRISGRETIQVDSFTRVLDRLFRRHVGGEIEPYRTHLPLYSLRAAATRFGEALPVEPEDWVPAPEGLRAAESLFVARVVGRSMEPRIPDGSLNVFRAPVVGSRQNRILLVEMLGEPDEASRYTVKRYTSRKTWSEGEDREQAAWEHASIRLEPLNPDFEAFDLAEGQFRALAEWVRVLE
ncbi:MAG: S24 family peptidase [Acidobacteria bacterium]|nr:S24 family peptidase [Acidobacteriota bacterium]